MAFKNYKEESKKNWGTNDKDLTLEQINTGAILRIADATEKMAGNYIQMERDLKWYKEKHLEKSNEIARLNRVIATLKGHITKYKNKLKNN